MENRFAFFSGFYRVVVLETTLSWPPANLTRDRHLTCTLLTGANNRHGVLNRIFLTTINTPLGAAGQVAAVRSRDSSEGEGG